jgi:glycosyltransferase involved in cell wall biosynthesis
MTDAHVFVFPSLAEGSARVVFEALATACYVITTPNSGSIVEDGIHGALIPPGDVESIGGAIRRAAGDVARVAEIGRSNQLLIHSSYRQADYGTALVALYDSLTESRSAA